MKNILTALTLLCVINIIHANSELTIAEKEQLKQAKQSFEAQSRRKIRLVEKSIAQIQTAYKKDKELIEKMETTFKEQCGEREQSIAYLTTYKTALQNVSKKAQDTETMAAFLEVTRTQEAQPEEIYKDIIKKLEASNKSWRLPSLIVSAAAGGCVTVIGLVKSGYLKKA